MGSQADRIRVNPTPVRTCPLAKPSTWNVTVPEIDMVMAFNEIKIKSNSIQMQNSKKGTRNWATFLRQRERADPRFASLKMLHTF